MWVHRMAVRASLVWMVVAAMTLLSTAHAAVWSVSDAAELRAAMEAAANEDVISITRDVSFDDANADSTLSHLVLPADSEAHMKNLTFEGDCPAGRSRLGCVTLDAGHTRRHLSIENGAENGVAFTYTFRQLTFANGGVPATATTDITKSVRTPPCRGKESSSALSLNSLA